MDAGYAEAAVARRRPHGAWLDGQRSADPLARYVEQRERVISDIEERFGISPASRMRLGIVVGDAALTAAEIQKKLGGQAAEAAPEGWEGIAGQGTTQHWEPHFEAEGQSRHEEQPIGPWSSRSHVTMV